MKVTLSKDYKRDMTIHRFEVAKEVIKWAKEDTDKPEDYLRYAVNHILDKDTFKKIYSETYDREVYIFFEKHEHPWFECSRCGKPVKAYYVIQDAETDLELAYLGTECIKHLR